VGRAGFDEGNDLSAYFLGSGPCHVHRPDDFNHVQNGGQVSLLINSPISIANIGSIN